LVQRLSRVKVNLGVPPVCTFRGQGWSITLIVGSANLKESDMAREDVAAGKMKQARGKANDVIGAAKGDTSQQLKGKAQKAIGKAQAKMGKASSSSRSKGSSRRGM
jgi:uncharacterized protein YjbJ (UPF0337 family)